MKEHDREIRKKYERIGKLKADVDTMPKPFTVAVYLLTIIAVAALLATIFMQWDFGMWVALGSGFVDIILYFAASLRGPIRYTEVMIKHEGVYLLFQIIKESQVIFTDGNYTLEYKKKQVSERPEGILNPYLSYNAPLAAEYTACEQKGMKTVYTGNAETDGKKVEYKVTVEGKFISGFKANGRSIMFDCINQKDAGLSIPAPLAAAISERGTVLPANQIFISNK